MKYSEKDKNEVIKYLNGLKIPSQFWFNAFWPTINERRIARWAIINYIEKLKKAAELDL